MPSLMPRWKSRRNAADMEARGDYEGAMRELQRSSYGSGVPGRIRGVSATQRLASTMASRGIDPDAVQKRVEDGDRRQENREAAGREEAYRQEVRARKPAEVEEDPEGERVQDYEKKGYNRHWSQVYADTARSKRKAKAAAKPATPAKPAPDNSASATGDGIPSVSASAGGSATVSKGVTARATARRAPDRSVTEGDHKMSWEEWKRRQGLRK